MSSAPRVNVPSYKLPDLETGLSDNVTPFWMVGGAAAEVEVDTETATCAFCG